MSGCGRVKRAAHESLVLPSGQLGDLLERELHQVRVALLVGLQTLHEPTHEFHTHCTAHTYTALLRHSTNELLKYILPSLKPFIRKSDEVGTID